MFTADSLWRSSQWNSAWSANAGPIQTDTDYQYLSVLGGKSYMPTISVSRQVLLLHSTALALIAWRLNPSLSSLLTTASTRTTKTGEFR